MNNIYFSIGMITPIKEKVEALNDAAKLHIKTMAEDPEIIEAAKKLSEVMSNQIEELKIQKKALGKPPRLSRSKSPDKRAQNNAERDAFFEKKAKLEDEVNNLNERKKQLISNPNTNNPVASFYKAFNSMCNANYQEATDGSKYIPSYHDVYERLMFAREHCASCKMDIYDDWNKAVEAFGFHEYSDDLIKMALAFLAASKRAHQYPHNLSLEQVFDGFNDEPWEHQLAIHIRQYQLGQTLREAIKCTRLSNDSRTDIEHISSLMDAATPSIQGCSPVSNFYLSTPMGGVYNAEVDGQVHNSGSKTDGVLLPTILTGLKAGHYITVVVHRITLTHDIHKRVESYIGKEIPSLKNDIWHYEAKVALFNPRVLVVCVNSLTRTGIADFINKSKVVIVDEFTQVLDNIPNLLEGDGEKGDVQQALATFDILAGKITDHCTTFIALDADLESKTIELINKHTQTESHSIVFNISHPECQLPPVERTKQAIFHRDKKTRSEIKSCLHRLIDERTDAKNKATNNGRFFIAVDSKNQSASLAEYCKQQGLSVCLINSDTTQAKDDFGAYGLMRGKCQPEHFDAVVFSPSITSGVSWTTPNFTKGIVIANKTISSGNLKQMLFRFRHTKLVHVFSHMTPVREWIPADPSKKALVNSLAESTKFGQLYLEVREHRREVEYQSTHNQRCYLAHQLDAEGWGVSTFDPTSKPNGEVQSYPSISSTVRTDAIMDSRRLNMQQYKDTTSQYNKTNKIEDIYSVIRFKSVLYGAVSDVEYDVWLWVSGAAERVVGPIQTQLLAKDTSLTLQVLDTCLAQCGFPDWQSRLACGEDFSVLSADCFKFLLNSLDDPLLINAMYALGIFDGGKESNRKRWIRTNGAPIKETAVVISHAKVMYSNSGCLLTDISKKLMPPYKAFQLFDGNVLVINTEPKNSAFGGSMIRKLLAFCGIPAQIDDRSTRIDGKKALALINMAKRRSVSSSVMTQLAEASETIRSVRLKCLTDVTGFDLKIFGDGETRIIATNDVIERITEQEKLARSGVDVSYSGIWGSQPALPHLELGCTGNEALNWQEVHLTSEKQQVEREDFAHIEYQLSILDYVRLLLPSLLADSSIVESMLHNLDLQVITQN